MEEIRQRNRPASESTRNEREIGGSGSFSPQTHNYGSAAEYAEAVRVWLWAYHNWYLSQCLAPFCFQQSLALQSPQQRFAGVVSQQVPYQQQAPQQAPIIIQNGAIPAQAAYTGRAVQYIIPTFGRRLLAETIDFSICFALSLIVTYVLVEVSIIDLDKYEKIFNHEADLKTFIDITQDLFPLEIAKRLITSFLEAFYLAYGLGTVPAGRTPGKLLMGLKVVSCVGVHAVAPRDYRVIVYAPEEKLPFLSALIRSMIKNFALGFLFPLCLTMYMFRYNRSMYDIAAGTIVVEA